MAGSRARRPQSSFLAPTTPRFSQRLRERGTAPRTEPFSAGPTRQRTQLHPPGAGGRGRAPVGPLTGCARPGLARFLLPPGPTHGAAPRRPSRPAPLPPRPAGVTRLTAHARSTRGPSTSPPPGCPQPCRTAWPYCGPCRPSGAALGGPGSPREGLRGRAAAPGLRIGAGRGVEVPAAGGGRGAAARLGSGPRGDPCRSAGRAEGCGSPRRAGRAVPSASGTALRERAGPGGTGGIGSQSCERPADGSGGGGL